MPPDNDEGRPGEKAAPKIVPTTVDTKIIEQTPTPWYGSLQFLTDETFELPHPTKTGQHATYRMADAPDALIALADDYSRIRVESPVREHARERLGAVLYSMQNRRLEDLAEALEVVAQTLRDRDVAA